MDLHFQRRVRVFPGVYRNLSHSAVPLSVGGRDGACIGITAHGRRFAACLQRARGPI